MGGGSAQKPKEQAAPPQAQPIDYGKLMTQGSKAAARQFRDQLAAQLEAYPEMEGLQLGTISKIADNLRNDYTETADAALYAAAGETGKLTAAGDRIGTTATRADELAASAQQFAQGPTALDRQISTLGASAMSQQADQVQGSRIGDLARMDSARVGSVGNVAGASTQAAQTRNVENVQGATTQSAQMRNASTIQGPSGYSPAEIRAQQISAAQAGPVSNVQGATTGPVERVAGTRVAAVGPASSAQVRRVQDVRSRDIQASAAENALMQEAVGGGLSGQLRAQAQNDLALGRSLSAEQSRDAIQSARSGAASRGMATGNSALAAELLNRDRYATQRESERRAFAGNVLNQSTEIQQAANQAYTQRQDANAGRALQAGLSNQSVAANRAMQNAQFAQQANLADNQNAQQRVLAEAGYAQQAGLSNQDFSFRAGSQNAQLAQQSALQNQQTALQLGLTNAQFQQAAALANQQSGLQAGQLNQAAAARAAEFQQQGGLQAALANQGSELQTNQFNAANQQAANLANAGYSQQAALSNQQTAANTGQFNAANQQAAFLANAGYSQQAALQNQQTAMTLGLTEAQFQQAAAAANFDAANNRAFTEAGYSQQASLANQDANQRQVEANRAFLQNANQSGINSEISRGGYAMGALGQTANLYGQQAGAYQNAAGLGLNIANQSMANDPYMRAFAPGTTIGGSTLGTSANMIGNTWQGATQMAGNVASFNANMLDSRYNSYMNNNAALQGAALQAGAAGQAGTMGMIGSIGGGVLMGAGLAI
jgi:hypothetical protein